MANYGNPDYECINNYSSDPAFKQVIESLLKLDIKITELLQQHKDTVGQLADIIRQGEDRKRGIFQNQNESLKTPGESLNKKNEKEDQPCDKNEKEVPRVDERCDILEETVNVRSNTVEVIPELRKETQEIDQQNNHPEVPEAGDQHVLKAPNRKFTLGQKQEVILKIEELKFGENIPTREAMNKVLKLENFTQMTLAELERWYQKKSKILEYLDKYPHHVDRYRITKGSN